MRRTSLFVRIFGALVLLTGCAPESSLGTGAAGGEPQLDPEAVLRERFPSHAGEVLDQEGSYAMGDREILLGAGQEGGAWRRVSARLPLEASGVVTMEVTGGFSIRIREVGLTGRAQSAGSSISFRRAGGTSYWTVGERGLEEWLSIDAGVLKADEPVAVWEVEGATLQQNGELVHILDERGFAQMTVSAPKAYAGGEREIEARLIVAGSQIELFTDGRGEAVLIDPAWTATSNMSTGRYFHTLVYIPSINKALASAGIDHNDARIKTAELFNPATGSWAPAASMANEHAGATATLLSNGKVLVAGGGGVGSSNAEIYDPGSNTWSAAGSASFGYHTATVLNDNRVLVAQGSAQIYNPATNTWSAAASMSSSRLEAVSALLTVGPNAGKVLVAGGYLFPDTFSTTELYNPATNTWAAGPSMSSPRHCHVATVLSDGRILVTGGEVINSGTLNSAEIYDPNTNTWTSVAPMSVSRCHHQAVRLPNNKVLVMGASNSGSAQLYDPATNSWTTVSPMTEARVYHEAVLLGNGDVLVAGGSHVYGPPALFSAETFRQQANGVSCGASGDCTSGFCVDGKCCNTSCAGTCIACSAAKKGSGADGACGSIGAGLDPDNECTTQAQVTCGTSGACSGASSCQLYVNGTVCVAGSCNGSLATKPDLCNGTGTCVDGGTQQCAPFACSGGICYTSCSSDIQCAAGNYCAAPSCVAQKVVGSPCSAGNQCQSGLCVDSVCCSSACGASCMACSSAKTGAPDGTCAFIPGGQDPDGECFDQGAPSCGQNGSCSGSGVCGFYTNGTVCNMASCTGTLFHPADLCNGSGSCVDGGNAECEPYACAPAGCKTTCAVDLDCAPDAYCAAPVCALKKPLGSTCVAANECLSASCADGVCCDVACDGVCEACSVSKKGSGSNGTCGPVSAGNDPDSECADEGAPSCGNNGLCDGAGACQKYMLGEICKPGTCDGTVWSGIDLCNGTGTCVDATDEECWPFACGIGGCWEMCENDDQCASDTYCIAPACYMKGVIGVSCTADNECQSGSCVDGFCCDSACDSPCEACAAALKGTGDDGVCGAVAAATDPDGDCTPADSATCGEDGMCDGAGACRKYVAGVECIPAACDGFLFVPASQCDGNGVCVAGTNEDCAPFACDPKGCLTKCAADDQCAPTAYCDVPKCVDKKPAGETCDSDSQCVSGQCEDGTCCEGSCGSGGSGGVGQESSKSFYACSAAPSGEAPPPLPGIAALLSGLSAVLRRRWRAERRLRA